MSQVFATNVSFSVFIWELLVEEKLPQHRTKHRQETGKTGTAHSIPVKL